MKGARCFLLRSGVPERGELHSLPGNLQTAQPSVRPAAGLNMRYREILPLFPLVRCVGTSPAEADLSFHLEAIKRNKAKQKIKPRTRETSTFSVSEVKFPEASMSLSALAKEKTLPSGPLQSKG